MTEPKRINYEMVLYIHQQQLSEHGGIPGIRDLNMLHSALDRPQNLFHYHQGDLPNYAAAYSFGICKNYPFFDGNKRVAAVIWEFFLELNEVTNNATDEEIYKIFMNLAAGNISESQLCAWIRNQVALDP